jgi:hypothetical protein
MSLSALLHLGLSSGNLLPVPTASNRPESEWKFVGSRRESRRVSSGRRCRGRCNRRQRCWFQGRCPGTLQMRPPPLGFDHHGGKDHDAFLSLLHRAAQLIPRVDCAGAVAPVFGFDPSHELEDFGLPGGANTWSPTRGGSIPVGAGSHRGTDAGRYAPQAGER